VKKQLIFSCLNFYRLQETLSNTTTPDLLTIFLAEDDLDDQEFIKEALLSTNRQISLVMFSNGIKFLNHLSEIDAENLPSLIILDYNIPEINGAKILEQLSLDEKYAGIPKIVWSTSNSELFRQNCLAHGATAYLVKPASIKGIHEMAKEMLAYCRIDS
jgi:two-component system chemotaxis response regulator CheY